MHRFSYHAFAAISLCAVLVMAADDGEESSSAPLPIAHIDGSGPGFTSLGSDDFINVNCNPDTWSWEGNSVSCSGTPVGVTRSKKSYTNFEFVCEWRHLRNAGNSGIFIWSPLKSLDRLKGPGLPEGIEVQVLDLSIFAF